MGPYMMHWFMINYCFDHGYDRYNFYGLSGDFTENSEDYGVYRSVNTVVFTIFSEISRQSIEIITVVSMVKAIVYHKPMHHIWTHKTVIFFRRTTREIAMDCLEISLKIVKTTVFTDLNVALMYK